ncbi:MAG TPA: FRG domain-containing protein [Phycisphaerae bacterium]|nr:FRG domain-containing protein [Phycisphaerae bacterium]
MNSNLTSLEELVACARKHPPEFWLFRGHKTTKYLPTPKAHRPDTFPNAGNKPGCGDEAWICQAFRDKAHSVYARCPADDHYFEWLALMRHHLAPTRLLDWSRNILVAAYFAVEPDRENPKDRKSDRQIWALNATALTDFARDEHVSAAKTTKSPLFCGCLAHQKNTDGNQAKRWSVGRAAETLAKQAVIDERAWPDHQCTAEHCCRFPLAIAPPRTFPRMVSQASWFTVHPKPSKVSLSLEQINKEHKDRSGKPLWEHFVIPATAKDQILDDLAAVGVSRATLYPDLDGLAQSLLPDYGRLCSQLVRK